MTRSLWKGPFVDNSLLKPSNLIKEHQKTWSRRSLILPKFKGKSFSVHNGKSFVRLLIIESMIGHKFGEFVSTRKSPKHKEKKGIKK